MKPIIGSALKDCDKVQRFAHKDPHPEISFTEPQLFTKSNIAWLMITLSSILLIIATSYS